MNNGVRADFSRTCAGCRYAAAELWARGKRCYRCGADGKHKGYVVGMERFLPYIPAWCPYLAENCTQKAE